MAWFGAAYAYEDPKYFDTRNRTKYFGSSDTQSAQQLTDSLGGQQNAQQVGAQTYANAQGNALGLANSARGGRGNSMARSAMLQAPEARQQATQAQYGQQQANFQAAQQSQDFESQRRAAHEARVLGEYKAGNEDALNQQRSTNNIIDAIGGMAQAASMSDERTKRVIPKPEKASPSVIIMIGQGEHEHAMGLDDDDAGDDALDAMRAVEPSTYEYKDEFKGMPGAGGGEYTGIMAQDLEKTPAGKGAVAMGPDGLRRVDGAKLAALNTAALSRVVKDVDKLKGARRA